MAKALSVSQSEQSAFDLHIGEEHHAPDRHSASSSSFSSVPEHAQEGTMRDWRSTVVRVRWTGRVGRLFALGWRGNRGQAPPLTESRREGMIDRLELARQYVQELLEKGDDIVGAFAVGSVARGNTTEASDIDLCLIVEGLEGDEL